LDFGLKFDILVERAKKLWFVVDGLIRRHFALTLL
jgi:hypothetical protein